MDLLANAIITPTKIILTFKRLPRNLKVTALLINNFIGAKVYCLKLALLCLFCVKWT